MDQAGLQSQITRLRDELRKKAFPHERAIVSGVVKVLLRSLGWDTDNFRAVYEEFKAVPDDSRKRVDLALFTTSDLNHPDVYIEVKDQGKLESPEREKEAEAQLWEYDRHNRVRLAVLTDGQIWHFYYSLATGSYSDRRAYTLDLLSRTVEDSAHYLTLLLAHDNVKSGAATEATKTLHHERTQESRVRAEFPDVWQALLTNPNEYFLEGVLSAFQQKHGTSPNTDLIKKLLRELVSKQPTFDEIIPGSEPSLENEYEPRSAGTGHKSARTRIRVTINWNRAGKGLPREVIDEGKASMTLVKVIGRLAEVYGQNVLERLCAMEVNRGPLVTKSPNSLYQHQRLLGYFVLTHSSTPEKVQIVKDLERFLSLPASSLEVEVLEN